jgi:hypothetical protein
MRNAAWPRRSTPWGPSRGRLMYSLPAGTDHRDQRIVRDNSKKRGALATGGVILAGLRGEGTVRSR